jgi:hypothetical protein
VDYVEEKFKNNQKLQQKVNVLSVEQS